MSEFVDELNRLAGTEGLEAAGAANAFAGTSGLEVVGALNAANGTTGVGLDEVCRQLAGLSGGESAQAALAQVTLGPTYSELVEQFGAVEYYPATDADATLRSGLTGGTDGQIFGTPASGQVLLPGPLGEDVRNWEVDVDCNTGAFTVDPTVGGLTVAFWLYHKGTNAVNANGGPRAVWNQGDTTNGHLIISSNNAAAPQQWFQSESGGTWGSSLMVEPPQEVWTHYAATFAADGSVEVFLDGVSQVVGASQPWLGAATGYWKVAHQQDYRAGYFAFFDSILTGTEIADLAGAVSA